MTIKDTEIKDNGCIDKLEQCYWDVNSFEYKLKNGLGSGRYIPKYVINVDLFNKYEDNAKVISEILMGCYKRLRLFNKLYKKQFNYNSSCILEYMLFHTFEQLIMVQDMSRNKKQEYINFADAKFETAYTKFMGDVNTSIKEDVSKMLNNIYVSLSIPYSYENELWEGVSGVWKSTNSTKVNKKNPFRYLVNISKHFWDIYNIVNRSDWKNASKQIRLINKYVTQGISKQEYDEMINKDNLTDYTGIYRDKLNSVANKIATIMERELMIDNQKVFVESYKEEDNQNVNQ